MKFNLKKTILYFVFGFIVFFIFRLIYGYTAYPEGETENTYNSYQYNDYYYSDENSFDYGRNNYASSKYEYKQSTNAGEQITTVDQKYEKIADMSCKTGEFDKDEKQIREVVENLKSIIQFEQKSGTTGYRYLNLAIGVPPENFDALIDSIKQIGALQSINISKTDKTNEYKELNAKRISLEKTRESLISLKTHGGTIAELIELENQILSIEEQIQDLGISLGDYDSENEFCTVKLTLRESIYKTVEISVMQRMKVALEWTIKYYAITIVALILFILFSWLVVFVLQSANLISKEKK